MKQDAYSAVHLSPNTDLRSDDDNIDEVLLEVFDDGVAKVK